MTEFSPARRLLLRGTAAWAGGIAAIVVARPAGAAMQRYDLNTASNLGVAVANRCGPANGHADIEAELRARLAADPSLATVTEKCPICGCPVVVSRADLPR